MAKQPITSTPSKPARQRGPNGRYLVDTAADAAPITAPAAETAIETITAAAPVATTQPEKEMTMATTAETMKTATETGMAGVADRARETMDRSTKAFGEMTEFSRGNVEALVAAGRAAAAGVETMTQTAIESSRKNIEATTSAFRTLAAAKTPNEFMQLHTDFAKSQFDGFIADASRTSEMMLKLMGEVFEPLSNRMAIAVDRVAKAGAR